MPEVRGRLKVEGDWEDAAGQAIKKHKADVPLQPKRAYKAKKKGPGKKPGP